MKKLSWPKSINYRLIISGILELLGVAAISYGFFLLAPFAGAFAAGASLVWVARAIDPPAVPFRNFLLALAGQRTVTPPQTVVVQQGREDR